MRSRRIKPRKLRTVRVQEQRDQAQYSGAGANAETDLATKAATGEDTNLGLRKADLEPVDQINNRLAQGSSAPSTDSEPGQSPHLFSATDAKVGEEDNAAGLLLDLGRRRGKQPKVRKLRLDRQEQVVDIVPVSAPASGIAPASRPTTPTVPARDIAETSSAVEPGAVATQGPATASRSLFSTRAVSRVVEDREEMGLDFGMRTTGLMGMEGSDRKTERKVGGEERAERRVEEVGGGKMGVEVLAEDSDSNLTRTADTEEGMLVVGNKREPKMRRRKAAMEDKEEQMEQEKEQEQEQQAEVIVEYRNEARAQEGEEDALVMVTGKRKPRMRKLRAVCGDEDAGRVTGLGLGIKTGTGFGIETGIVSALGDVHQTATATALGDVTEYTTVEESGERMKETGMAVDVVLTSEGKSKDKVRKLKQVRFADKDSFDDDARTPSPLRSDLDTDIDIGNDNDTANADDTDSDSDDDCGFGGSAPVLKRNNSVWFGVDEDDSGGRSIVSVTDGFEGADAWADSDTDSDSDAEPEVEVKVRSKGRASKSMADMTRSYTSLATLGDRSSSRSRSRSSRSGSASASASRSLSAFRFETPDDDDGEMHVPPASDLGDDYLEGIDDELDQLAEEARTNMEGNIRMIRTFIDAVAYETLECDTPKPERIRCRSLSGRSLGSATRASVLPPTTSNVVVLADITYESTPSVTDMLKQTIEPTKVAKRSIKLLGFNISFSL